MKWFLPLRTVGTLTLLFAFFFMNVCGYAANNLQLVNPHKNYPYYLKGQMHAHSNHGVDGEWKPYELGDIYGRFYGYAFIAITDHAYAPSTGSIHPAQDPKVPGLLHLSSLEDGNWYPHHMGVVGINASKADTRYCPDSNKNGVCDYDTGPCINIQPRIDFNNSQGAITTLHHPGAPKYPFHVEDQMFRSGYTAVEIWNTNTGSKDYTAWWDEALCYGHISYAVAADDYEKKGDSISGGWINVNSHNNPTLMSQNLKTSLANPSLYASYKNQYTKDVLDNIRSGNFFAVKHTNYAAYKNMKYLSQSDPGPQIAIATYGNGVIRISNKSDVFESNPSFTVVPIVQKWTARPRTPSVVTRLKTISSKASAASSQHEVLLNIRDLTESLPHRYRWVRFEIVQKRHNDTYTVYSQPIQIRYAGIPIPSGSGDKNYETRDWLVTKTCTLADSCPVYHNEWIGLFNTTIRKWVTYGSRDYGINLVWSDAEDNSIKLVRKNGPGQLRYGDSIAISVRHGNTMEQYLKYESRDHGINLKWDTNPIYEWVATGGPSGSLVYYNQPFGLKNINKDANSEVVYCWRQSGIHLKWRKDCSPPQQGRLTVCNPITPGPANACAVCPKAIYSISCPGL